MPKGARPGNETNPTFLSPEMRRKIRTQPRKIRSAAPERTLTNEPAGWTDEKLGKFLRQRRAEVDKALESFLSESGQFPETLHRAMRHSLFSGGKRLRPILVLAAAEACGGNRRLALPAACALECLHTYSLIHDDLPAMDNDDLRRGRPTCHKVFGEAAAILAGDALLTLAFEILARSASGSRAGETVRILAQAAGMAGMVGGQMADVEAEGKEVELPLLQYIHTHKTGCLIEAALRIGALAAGGSVAQQNALGRYGECIGLAFQIADDVLNVVGEVRELGKNVGTDTKRGKATYPALIGLAESRRHARDLVERGCNELASFGKAAASLQALAWYTIKRKG